MQLNSLVILSSVFVIGYAVFKCNNGKNQCHLSQWGQWSYCKPSCGGGTSRKIKQLCCNTSYKTIEKCAVDCNITAKDYIEDKVCGHTCVNGVFRQNKCQCPQRFTGKCCESEIATNGFNTSQNTKSCKQGCKFGNCNAGKCSCMIFFKGNTCNQPKQWFIVAAAVLGTIAFMMTVCCIGRFCCGYTYGKKVAAIEIETSGNKRI
ncbi:neurogenic locus notch homolog protein 2-like [Mytilus edulis]|uniref:neurogenic locus notch homolog protein 2-like n=1 Tax=Mytilus edulis TaxID=6550 RepID=UPI0039EE1458